MIKLVLLFVFLLILIFISVMASNGSVLNPQFLFIAGFALSVGYAFFYVSEMKLELSSETFFILFMGIFTFFAVSLFCQKISRVREKRYVEDDAAESFSFVKGSERVSIDFWKLIIFLMVNLCCVVLFIRYLREFSGKSSISAAIRYFDYAKKFTDKNVDVPGLVSVFRMASAAIIYICIYLLAHQIVHCYKQNRLLIYGNILLSLVNTILSGGRSGIIEYIFAFALMAYFIYKAKYDFKRKIPMRVVVFMILAVLIAIPVFYISASLMGRGKQTDIFHYICIYLSGELKNFDVFIRKGVFGTSLSNSQTLVGLRQTVLPSFGITGWDAKLDLPFYDVNGFSTGNVYTIFYMFMYDGGYRALFFFTILMALLASLSYKFIVDRKYRKYYGTINLPLIIYSQIAFAVLFSFFSDRFYELILDLAAWRKTVVLIVFVWFATRFKFTTSNETVMLMNRKEFILVKNMYTIRSGKEVE
ncbi:MAG TPA: hypothetical protein DEO87_02030 [Lachnospiraceae bacterium]|nr:hypothetical protein [Lachnospiraceae bacterium]